MSVRSVGSPTVVARRHIADVKVRRLGKLALIQTRFTCCDKPAEGLPGTATGRAVG